MSRNRSRFVMAGAVLLAFAEAFVDATTWVQLDVAAIYGLPLVLAAIARSRRLLWTLTAGLTLTTFVVYALQIPAGAFGLAETFFVNRVLDALAVLLTAGLLHVWMISVETMDAQARLLAQQNIALVRHEEQIARQNAELDRRRAEAEEANLRKTQVLASISHDIRTPVNTINLMAEVIRRTAETPALSARLPELTQRLQANALGLVELVSAVLDAAQFESGRVEYRESVFSLNELLTVICGDLLPVAQAKGVQVDTEFPERAIWVRTDRVKLGRVISNLVTNAIKFTGKGNVTVGAALTDDRELLIAVRDTGIGIAPQQVAGIFGEFAQADNAEGARKPGWGLGLAICQRLVNLMGGTITVQSELHHGSTFTVRLPAKCVTEEAKDASTLKMTVESYRS